eukprot:8115777-Pyramimonas_sp.AAC.1
MVQRAREESISMVQHMSVLGHNATNRAEQVDTDLHMATEDLERQREAHADLPALYESRGAAVLGDGGMPVAPRALPVSRSDLQTASISRTTQK